MPEARPAWGETRATIRLDLERRRNESLRNALFDPAVRFTIVLRVSAWLRGRRELKPLDVAVRLWMLRARHRYGYDIPSDVPIGPGLLLSTHPGGIVVNPEARIGRNCNLSHQVTIGRAYGGRAPGVPTLGDHVYVGPGAKVVGGIDVGDNAAIGANAVVTTDVPAGAVVGGVPARVISGRGAFDYVRDAAA